MKTITWRLWAAVALIGLVCLIWLGLAITLLWAVLSPEDWIRVTEALGGRIGLLLFLWGIALIPIYQALNWLMARYIVAPERLADAIELRLKGTDHAPIEEDELGVSTTRRLRGLINTLLDEHQHHQTLTEEKIQAAVQQTEQERAWLSALLAELNRSVIVCNRQGQILLYNNRARLQFKRLSAGDSVSNGGELLGLGRSIYAVIDRPLVEHALKTIERRLRQGLRQTSTQCLMQTERNRTYRIHITPVCREDQSIDGMILVIENITDVINAKSDYLQRLSTRISGVTQHLNKLRETVKPITDAALYDALTKQLEDLDEALIELPVGHHPAIRHFPLEEVSLQDCMDGLQQHCDPTRLIDWQRGQDWAELWIEIDSFALERALMFVIDTIHDLDQSHVVAISGRCEDDEVIIELAWPGDDSVETWADWPFRLNDKVLLVSGPLAGTFHDIINYHGGHWGFYACKVPPPSYRLQIHLPKIPPQDQLPEALAQRHEGRPEHYDFRLFDVTLAPDQMIDKPLDQLTYTVFDTETTGLNPSAGDEIIQIGAIRIVNGRILGKEIFDQLIDPKRPIPASSTKIHGIRPEDVMGQPEITPVIQLFHRYCQDTVLVAHNGDFDLQCLAMKAPRAGVFFDHPLLDTLLLSAIAHPFQERHSLDEIAKRLGLPVMDRHQALGDAKLTAEIFIRLIPILKDKGIYTLHDATVASKAVWQKRARY